MIRSFICNVVPTILKTVLAPTACFYYLLLIIYISLLAGPQVVFRYIRVLLIIISFICDVVPMMLISCLLLLLATNLLHFLTCRSKCSIQVCQGFIDD